MFLLSVALALVCAPWLISASTPTPLKTNGSPVTHLIVLMMENRSFDHMLGWLSTMANRSDIDGLFESDGNYLYPHNFTSKFYPVNKNGLDITPDDPLHDWYNTTLEIFGYEKEVGVTGVPDMSGFARSALTVGNDPQTTVSMHTLHNDSAPILNQLALEYTVFDRWFCSLPGPTDPNRGYAMSGTSRGRIENFNGTLWTQPSIFGWFTDKAVSWKAYYQDDPWAVAYYNDTVNDPTNAQNLVELNDFYHDLGNGTLPQFSWIQPRLLTHAGNGGAGHSGGSLPTWQHPDASVQEGERLIKAIYEALRASSYWESSALLITYDEHGGFFDHVPPPQDNIPAPDSHVAPNGFAFDRQGIRVPTVLVSPWVAKRAVHQPDGPTDSSEFDGTSTIASACELFNVDCLQSNRLDWAGRFTSLFDELDTPRTDCPMTLAELPPPPADAHEVQRNKPLNEHLEIQLDFYCKFNYLHLPEQDRCHHTMFRDQGEASDFILREAPLFMKHIKSGNGPFLW